MSANVEIFWALVELMGHVAMSGRVETPGELGLWKIDIPNGEEFRTEFFGSASVYRIRPVSEEIARAYAKPASQVYEWNAPVITRDEHMKQMEELRERLTKALPAGNQWDAPEEKDGVPDWDDDSDDDEREGDD